MRHVLPPSPIARFYSSSNGVRLLWNGKLAGQRAQGSINIITLLRSTSRAPAQEDGAPLEGVLWNDEFAPRVLKGLKRMAIFEEIAGRSAYLTYFVDNDDARLFLVDNDRIKPLVPDFATTIQLLKRYAGADGLREHLTHGNWQARVESDVVLRGIAEL